MMNLDFLTATRYLKIYDWYTKNYDNDEFMKSLSPNQVKAKLWMVEELAKIPELNTKSLNVEIVGGWFGWPLIQFLQNEFELNHVEIFDIDKAACRVCYQYRSIFEYSKEVIGVTNKDYWKRSHRTNADLIINCSSEHMLQTFYQNNIYQKGCIFAIQGNNYFDEPTHVNCCENEDELVAKHKIRTVFYKGTMNFNDLSELPYKRFMTIGKL